MNMIEKVARAIEAVKADRATFGNKGVIESKAYARAAIEAMREPTEGMIKAGSKGYPKFQLAYRNMIDAALKE